MYTPTIGLEIHAELLTESKLFCGCRNDPNEESPNTYVCPVCMGYPGALPYINKKAIEHVLRVGIALHGTTATTTHFDRKHYFYPDIPKGYQISQHQEPLVTDASLIGIPIERVHLEEDTAKSTHDAHPTNTLIDFNRSGVPLMELVTRPAMHTAEETTQFAETLQMILRSLGVARARMEWGEMRVEVNISISESDTLGTKVEIKNLNSFKTVRDAVSFEIIRQEKVLQEGNQVIQETRGWDTKKQETFSQRIKEVAAEYRYMPEPDLTTFAITMVPEWDPAVLQKTIPELPYQKSDRYTKEIGIPHEQAAIIIRIPKAADVFESAIAHDSVEPTAIANYLTTDVLAHYETVGAILFDRITGSVLGEIIAMVQSGELSSRGAKESIRIIAHEGGDPRTIAKEHNLFQESDAGVLQSVIETVIANNEEAVTAYQKGKEASLQFLVGQVMQETKGQANPQQVQKLLITALSS